MDALRLARENYGEALFIHPPFFVYSAALLRRVVRLPLPGYVLLCQGLTLALLPVLVYSVSGLLTASPLTRFQQLTNGMCLWAVVIYSSCPIAAFCSQKIWIDNALLLAVSLTVVAHTTLVAIPRALPAFSVNWNTAIMPTADNDGVERSGIVRKTPKDLKLQHQQRTRSLQLHFLSGLLYGAVALNCKISALALLPFLLSWALLQRLVHHLAQIGANLWAVVVWESFTLPPLLSRPYVWRVNAVAEDVAAHWLAFAGGAGLGHGPWVLLYWVSHQLVSQPFSQSVCLSVCLPVGLISML